MWHSKLALGRSKAVSSWDSISDTRQSLKLCLSHFRKKLIKNVETLCPDSQPVNTYHRSMNFNAYFWEIPIWKFLNKYLVRFRTTCWAAKNLATRELLSSVLKDSLLPLASAQQRTVFILLSWGGAFSGVRTQRAGDTWSWCYKEYVKVRVQPALWGICSTLKHCTTGSEVFSSLCALE